tara:strand:- start:1698 stop:2258 length:561 start_codon:yes stop_codon:yes gene_type:complete
MKTINDIITKRDPITQKIIRFRFGFCRNDVVIFYDAKVLHNYIFRTGDLRDPVTRQEYKLHELMRLDRIVGSKFRLSENQPFLKKVFREEMERSSLRDHILEEMTNLFVSICSKFEEDFETFTFYLENVFLPSYIQIRENAKTVCYNYELNNHKKVLKIKTIDSIKYLTAVDVRFVEMVFHFIVKI